MTITAYTMHDLHRIAEPKHDPVNHPAHYTQGTIECLDYIKDVLTHEEYVGFLRGQVIKYQHRLRLKGSEAENCAKMRFYADRLQCALETHK